MDIAKLNQTITQPSRADVSPFFEIPHVKTSPPNARVCCDDFKMLKVLIRGDYRDPLVQNQLGSPVHSDLWGNIRHFCKRDIF